MSTANKQGDHVEGDKFADNHKVNVDRELRDDVVDATSESVRAKTSKYRMRADKLNKINPLEDSAESNSFEDKWEKVESEPTNSKTLKVFGVLTAVIVIALIWIVFKTKKAGETPVNEKTVSKPNLQEHKDAKTINDYKLVNKIIKSYLESKTLSEKAQHIYQYDSLKEVVDDYYQSNPIEIKSSYEIKYLYPTLLGEDKIWEVFVVNKKNESRKIYKYYLRKNTKDQYKVDWKSDVAFQDNDIESFIKNRSKVSKEFRFTVIPNNKIYNWGFGDQKYASYELRLPNSEKVLWGYLERGSVLEQELYSFIIDNHQALHVGKINEFILGVKFKKDAYIENDKYVLIDKIVSPKWIKIEK